MGDTCRMWRSNLVVMVVVVSTVCLLQHHDVIAAKLPNCSFPAIYSFGDSLTDVGNGIAVFPDQFAHSELNPYGVSFPLHAADRFSDGHLLVDFFEFGVGNLVPNYASFRSVGGDFTYGTNFAISGSSARNISGGWLPDEGFNVPFSLSLQMEWVERYKIHLMFYYFPSTTVKQSLPTYESFNQSLFMVWAGYQDYFFDLYDGKLTPRQSLDTVPNVVTAITTSLESLVVLEAKDILVVNLPPLGCMPALLTLYPGTKDKYNSHGCLTEINKISAEHNKLLGEGIVALRAKYPTVKFYYGDAHGVYTDILKDPLKYNVTKPLKAACGYGGAYNFNKEVTCSYTGKFGGKFVNLTMASNITSAHHLSFDGIHLSNTANKAIAKAFLTGKHITPEGGFKCEPDFSRFDGNT